MKISVLVMAAFAAGAMTIASHAHDVPEKSDESAPKTLLAALFPFVEQDEPTATKTEVEDPPFHAIVSRYAEHYGVPVPLAHAVIRMESNYRPTARGRAGEVGLMQIKPATARGMGYEGSTKALYEPENNIKFGMKYLGEAFRLGGGELCGTILKYNAGHGAKRMNPTSAAYCAKVKRLLVAQ